MDMGGEQVTYGSSGWGLHIERMHEDPWGPRILHKVAPNPLAGPEPIVCFFDGFATSRVAGGARWYLPPSYHDI